MTIYSIILFIVFASGLLLSAKVYYLDRASNLHRFTSVAVLCASLLAFVEYELSKIRDITTFYVYEGIHSFVVVLTIYLCIISIYLFTNPLDKNKHTFRCGALCCLYSCSAVVLSALVLFTDIQYSVNHEFSNGLWLYTINSVEHWYMKLYLSFFVFSYIILNFSFWKYFSNAKTAEDKRMKKRLFIFMLSITTAMLIAFCFYGVNDKSSAYLISPFVMICTWVLAWAFLRFKLFVLSPISALDNILDSMSNLTAISDLDFNVKYLNQIARADLGIHDSDLTNLSFHGIAATLNYSDWENTVKKIEQLKPNEQYQSEFVFGYNTRQVNYLICFTPIFNRSNEKQGYVAVATNITANVQAQIKLKKYNEKLQESNTELERFAFIASHDLKTPLRNITGFLTLIQKRIKPYNNKELNEYIRIANNGASQMYHLIQDVLEFSQLAQKDLQQNQPFVDLNEVITEVAQALRPALQHRNAVIYSDALPVIKGDKIRFTQLFQNLIENGLKYNNSKQPTIHVGYQKKQGSHQFQFKDNGIGIEEGYHQKIFEMFKRLHSLADYEGTGIGLAICKKIVSQYSGSIQISSAPGEGSCFTIVLKAEAKDSLAFSDSLKSLEILNLSQKLIQDRSSKVNERNNPIIPTPVSPTSPD